MKKLFFIIIIVIIIFGIIYLSIGFYLANTILSNDHSCGIHEGSLPNTWSTKKDYQNYENAERVELRKNFDETLYHLNQWESVYFPSRDNKIKINGWLFNYFHNKPIVIIVHGIFPNGKCNYEPSLIASLLIKNGFNALTIDLRNYGQSSIISNYDNLGATEYQDVLGAFDFLQTIGFQKYQIGLMGISLGGSSVIYAAANDSNINAIWVDSAYAEFNMVLFDEIDRYGMPNIFGPALSLAGKLLTGIDVTTLSPVYSLIQNHKHYYFTHGEADERVYVRHFYFFKEHVLSNNINAVFWLVPDTHHVEAMLKHPKEYGLRMKNFFEKYLDK